MRKLYGAKLNKDYGTISLKVEAALRSIATRDGREAKAAAKAKAAKAKAGAA